jgi:hypothetical protein|tara:strand:+ start:1451 stop:2176 length:726 start_codon:yes stop_codon:yes gene_type:complete
MAGPGAIRLAIDKQREEEKELQAYENYLDYTQQQAKDREEAGIGGKIIGGILGFMLGGPAGAIAGSTIGGAGAEYEESHNDAKHAKAFLDDQVYAGGKFNAIDMQMLKDDEIERQDALQDAYNTGYLTDAIVAGISILGAGGFEANSGLLTTDLTAGEYLTQLGGGKITDEATGQAINPTLGQGIKTALTGMATLNSPSQQLASYALTDYKISSAERSGVPMDAVVGEILANYLFNQDKES